MIPLLQKWRRFLPYLGGIAALLLFAAALIILHRHAQAYRPSEVRSALQTLQTWQLFAALGLAAASYWLLTLYDVLALRHVGRTLPYGGVALASCTAYAFSHAVGFGSIIGPSIRYRVYTPMELTAGEVAEMSGFVIVTFMTGLVAVFPVIALPDPSSLETSGISQVAGIAVEILGLVLTAGYIGLGWWMDRPIRLFGYPLHLPRPRTAVAQVALSVADLSLVAAVLYACLPHASAVGYPHVLAVYVLAFVAGLISLSRAASAYSMQSSWLVSPRAFLRTKSSPGCSSFGWFTSWCRWSARARYSALWRCWRPDDGLPKG